MVIITTDDTAPIQFNGSYFGGNHAMTGSTDFKYEGHNLTEADIGSIWKDSDAADTREYMLVNGFEKDETLAAVEAWADTVEALGGTA